MISFEDAALVALAQWDLEVAHTTSTLESMFTAADVNGDGVLTFDEFSSLVWTIAPSFSAREVTVMFREAQEDDNSMSPQSFVACASEHGLLSNMMRNKEFGGLKSRSDNWSLLESAWQDEGGFRVSLEELGKSSCPEEFIDQQNQRIRKLEELMAKKTNLQAAWLSFRTLGSTIERAILKYLGDILEGSPDDHPADEASSSDEP